MAPRANSCGAQQAETKARKNRLATVSRIGIARRALGAELADFEQSRNSMKGRAITLVRVLRSRPTTDFPDRAGARRSRRASSRLQATRSEALIRCATTRPVPHSALLLDALDGRLEDAVDRPDLHRSRASGYRPGKPARQAESTSSSQLRSRPIQASRAAAYRRAQGTACSPTGASWFVKVDGAYLGLCGIDPQISPVSPRPAAQRLAASVCRRRVSGHVIRRSCRIGMREPAAVVGATQLTHDEWQGDVRSNHRSLPACDESRGLSDGRVLTIKINLVPPLVRRYSRFGLLYESVRVPARQMWPLCRGSESRARTRRGGRGTGGLLPIARAGIPIRE